MRDVIIVISDLYVSQEEPEKQLPDGVTLSGLQHVVRFGTRVALEPDSGGWRSCLARWLGASDEVVSAAPATVAAFAMADQALASADKQAGQRAPVTGAVSALAAGGSTPATDASPPPTVWMATPVHLLAGLTSVHLDRRSALHLSPDESGALETDFRRTFGGDTEFTLHPVASGDFILLDRAVSSENTSAPASSPGAHDEPARLMGEDIAHRTQGAYRTHSGVAQSALRRLGAEMEMWLHDHPVNQARVARGDSPVTGLWLWGAGPLRSPVAPRAGRRAPLAESQRPDALFGNDAYLNGLAAYFDATVANVPSQLEDIFGYPDAQRAVLVIEMGSLLHTNREWSFYDALMHIDRNFIAPAVRLLGNHRFEQLAIVANDYEITLRARDRLKVWRRPRPGLSGLQ